MSDDDGTARVGLRGPREPWPYTMVRDWASLIPGLTSRSHQLYVIMRSLISDDKSKRSDPTLRDLSMDQLCYLLPGINGKPTSPSTMKVLLRELERFELLTDLGTRTVTSTGNKGIQTLTTYRYQVNDYPAAGYSGWRTAWDKLNAYRPTWRAEALAALAEAKTAGQIAGQNSDARDKGGIGAADPLVSQNSGSRGQNSGSRGQNSDEATRDDLRGSGAKEAVTKKLTEEDAGPSVRPSLFVEDAREVIETAAAAALTVANGTEGRTDGGEFVGQQEAAGTRVGGRVPSAPAAPVASAGQMLLLEIGRTHTDLRVSAQTLADQGAALDLRLAAGWDPELLIAQVTASPKNEPVINADSVVAWRIKHIALTPGVLPAHSASAPIPEQAGAPSRRTVSHRCPGHPGRATACGQLVGAEGILCPACLAHRISATATRPCATYDCDGVTTADSGRDLCPTCTSNAAESDIPRCSTEGCHRPAVLHGQCVQCRREQREHAEAEAAFAELLASGPPTSAPF